MGEEIGGALSNILGAKTREFPDPWGALQCWQATCLMLPIRSNTSANKYLRLLLTLSWYCPKLLIMLIRKIPRPGGYCTRWCKAKEDLTFISAPKHYFFELYVNHPMLPRPPPAITLLGAVQPHKDSVWLHCSSCNLHPLSLLHQGLEIMCRWLKLASSPWSSPFLYSSIF